MSDPASVPGGPPPEPPVRLARVADVAAVVERYFPLHLAADWDNVGLAVGSSDQPVQTVGFAVDCTPAVLAEAVAAGVDLLVVHHPPFLHGLRSLDLSHPKARLAADLLTAGLAVYVAHTNADVPRHGVVDTLARSLGLLDARPLQPVRGEQYDKIITFVPPDHTQRLIDALAAAGAGRIGDYERSAFSSAGQGTFTGRPGTSPYIGRSGQTERVGEDRLEMVLPRGRRALVVEALLDAHPYETPAYDLMELAEVTSAEVGYGRVGRLAEPAPLGEFIETVAAALPATPRGLLVAGDPQRPVATVALQAGAGDDLLDLARRAGADVYLTSDLRHHPAGESLAWPDAPALVDAPHWAAEWTWLPVVERLVAEQTGVRTHVSTLCTDPWTAHR